MASRALLRRPEQSTVELEDVLTVDDKAETLTQSTELMIELLYKLQCGTLFFDDVS